jgi:ureidoacrylate peracid hydrolase
MTEIVRLNASPEELVIDLARTAVVVIDMQNTFIARGGMFDLNGEDVETHRQIIPRVKAVIEAGRRKGCKVVFTRQIFSQDFREIGGPESVHWHRVHHAYLTRPELEGKMALEGTWGYQLIEEIKVQPGDILIDKPKYSAFFGTNLEMNLKTFDIKYLLFTGVATNVCVESTIRDAFYRLFWPIMVEDACANSGPPGNQKATVWNVSHIFGFVTSSAKVQEALK